jgi:hypothetical protein
MLADSIINLLDGGANRAKNDGEVKGLWMTPLVQDLVTNGITLVVLEALNALKVGRILGNECSLLQIGEDMA